MDAESARRQFRSVIGHFATGVAVITASHSNGTAYGMTTNALTALSLDPLLMLVCFDNTARTLPVVRDAGRFAVNVLHTGQEDLAGVFASKVPVEQKFDRVDYHVEHGAPVLRDALAWVACDLRELRPGGDHTIAIGAVAAMGEGQGDPLVFYRGRYTSVADAA
jgi:3-hydroxy-9,10-secoandrosta-1,3,5(10)-triene-9,17-dione monooxygenase reductase component